MQNNQPEIILEGDWVRNRLLGNMTLFRIRGPGSLQGSDAVEAFIAAINEPDIDDTYVVVPFTVEEAGASALSLQASAAAPAQQQTRASPLQYAPFGAVALAFGLLVWSRH